MTKTYENQLLQLIGQWFTQLSTYKLEDARKLKKEIDHLLSPIHLPKQIESYYDLVNLKHQLITNEISLHSNFYQSNLLDKDVIETTDRTLKYLHKFMQATIMMNNEDYINSIESLRVAEKSLDYVSKFEQAEFYFRTGYVYYRLDQNITALNYLNRSYYLVRNSKHHDRLKANLSIIKAGILSEAGYDKESIECSEKAVLLSIHEPLTKSMAIRSKANNEFRFGRYHKAAELYLVALKTGNQDQKNVGIKNRFKLAHSWLKMGALDQGKELLNQVENEINNNDQSLSEFAARGIICRELYLHDCPDTNKINIGLSMLKEKKLLYELKDVTKELSNFHLHNEEYKMAYYYLDYTNYVAPILGGDY
ncbi:tetratricopeptide repeat protein [Geomicrobium sediminis]|uniref:Response regulator aspartate phosphatase I n=1 Tax=Geomicrobium sediminis TaxID=1347788 RepID=A0ABS2PDK9_9BACL|nr:response regulator aspartate phosphatase I [Geomicrobium sediminis]